MMMGYTTLVVAALALSHVCAMKEKKPAYVNEYDGQVRFSCPDDQAIVQIFSRHNNNKEDRIWSYTCDYLPVSKSFDDCKKYDRAATLEEREVFQCPNNGFITGVNSRHNNDKMDRITEYTCCNVNGYIAHSCQYTPFVNDYDGFLNYKVPGGYVLTGELSIFNQIYRDRRWSYTVCKIDKKK